MFPWYSGSYYTSYAQPAMPRHSSPVFPWYSGSHYPSYEVIERCEPRGRHGYFFQGPFVHDGYWNNQRIMDWMNYSDHYHHHHHHHY